MPIWSLSTAPAASCGAASFVSLLTPSNDGGDAATARREHATIRRCISLWLDGGGRGSVHVGVYTLRSQIINVIAKHGSREYFARCERAVDDVERARRGFFAVVEQRRSFAVA